jgi:hypothetical protein
MGPATSFACPPLTLRATSGSVSTTYAVIAASSEFSSPEESGRVLWVWQDDNSLKAKEKQKLKRSKLVVRNIFIMPYYEQKSEFGVTSFRPIKPHIPFSHLLNFPVVL